MDLRSESKTQYNQFFDVWSLKVMGFSGVTKSLYHVGVNKVVTCSRLMSLTRHHQDLKLLVSRWSMESQIFKMPGESSSQLWKARRG